MMFVEVSIMIALVHVILILKALSDSVVLKAQILHIRPYRSII